MERILDKDEERAAPIVPEERANAAVGQSSSNCCNFAGHTDGPDVLRPKLGPDIYMKNWSESKRGGHRQAFSQQDLSVPAIGCEAQHWRM